MTKEEIEKISHKELITAEEYNSRSEKMRGWIARDKDGRLFMGYEKPERLADEYTGMWVGYGKDFMELPEEMFPCLKWEDEPIEVELIIRKI